MASNQINKYVWLVDTIHRARKISFEEINRKWLDSDLSEGVELPKRTFHKWRIAVEEMFGLSIENEQKGEFRYFIENESELSSGGMRTWILNTFTVSNLLLSSKSMNGRILLEDIPSGQHYLSPVIEAMKENRRLEITYQSYWKDCAGKYEIEPYCVKLFKQRWYVVAHSMMHGNIRIFALDRIVELQKLDNKFDYPKDFQPEEFFNGCYGIIACDNTKIEKVELQVSGEQACYIRSLPLHDTQKEVFRCDGYSIFQYALRPTFDFMQEVLAHGADVEVLAPLWFRQEVAEVANEMNKIYNR